MKKLISLIMALAALSFAAVSCHEEVIFQPGEPEEAGCHGVYFPVQEASGSHTLTPVDPTNVDILVKRTNSKGSISVPFEVTSADASVFSFGTIEFAEGQEETTLHVDFSSASAGKTFSFSLQIKDTNYISKYNDGATALDYSFMIVEWKEFYGKNASAGDKGHIYQICWEEDYDTQLLYYETSYPNIRFCKLVDAWHGNVETVDYEFYWDTQTNNLYVPHQWIGHTLADGRSVYTGAAPDFYDKYNGWGEVVPSEDYFSWAPAWIEKNGFFQPYYDGNGNFYLGDWLYLCTGGIPTGSGYQFGADDESGVDLYMAPGFIRVDYSIDMDLDYAKDGVMAADFEVGADVASIKVAGFEGELTATQIANKVAGITAGTEENIVLVSTEDFEADENGKVFSGTAGLSFEKSSVYTVVAVAFDKDGKAQNSASDSQFYVAAGDAADYAVEIAAGAEAVPSRFGEYDPSASFAYYVVGKDIEDAHIAVIESSKYNKSADEYNAEIKADEDEDYALDSDSIEAINGAGGYYAIVDGLSALTEYTVVVWATNGNSDGFTTTTFTTDGLANEVIKEGTAFEYGIVLNQLLFDTEDIAYDEGLNLEFNPNTEMYEIPHWGNDVTFKFTVSEDGEISVPIQAIGVSMATYGDFAVMDGSLCDTFFGAGAADYFGFDVTKKSFIDEDGNYHFYLLYASTGGYSFGIGYEVLYVDGVPSVKASAPAVYATKSSSRIQPVWESSFIGGFSNTVVERSNDSVKMTLVNVEPTVKSSSEKSIIKFKAKSLNL